MYQIIVVKTKRIETTTKLGVVEYDYVSDENNMKSTVVPNKEIASEIATEYALFQNVAHVYVRLIESQNYVQNENVYLKHEYHHIEENGDLTIKTVHTMSKFDWKNN